MKKLSLNKTYLNLKSFYYIPSTPLNLSPLFITSLSTKPKQQHLSPTKANDLSTTPPKIQTPTNTSFKHSASSIRIKRKLLTHYTPSPISPTNNNNNNSNTTAFKYRNKFTKSKHKTIAISTNPANTISSNYKRFLFPLSLSTSTLKRKSKRNITPDTTNATSTYIDNNNNNTILKQTNKSTSPNHSRNTNHHTKTKYLKTSYSYILSKENEVNIQKHFRRKFYDETHHTFYNALRTQKNQYKLNECNCLDDVYIQKQKNKPQVVMSYMVYKPNGMLNVVNKEKGDLIKYSDTFIKLKDVEFYKKSNQIVNQYQTYRVNAKVKDNEVKSIAVPKRSMKVYRMNTIQNKYEVIKRDYIKLQHRFKEYLNKSGKDCKYN